MTVEEDRLARWLKDGTPEPPVALQADEIIRLGLRTHRRRTLLPVVAAACVVVLITLLVTAVNRRHNPAPADRSPSRTVSATASPTPTARRTDALGVRPWRARELSRLDVDPDSLIAFHDRLFGLEETSAGGSLIQIDPRTGRVSGRAGFTVDDAVPSSPVVANGLVWVTEKFVSGVGTRYRVVGVRPDTMQVETRTSLVPKGTLVRSGDNELLVSSGRHIVLNPAFPAEKRTFTAPGPVSDLALTPDGSTLYEATGPQIDTTVTTQDVASKAFISATDIGSAAEAIQATGDGVFVTESSGNAAQAEFYPDGHHPPRLISNGGGGVDPEIHLSAGIAWAGGPDTLACVDPSTGRIRAKVDTGGYQAGITGLTALGGHLYAVYHGYNTGPRNALIEMTPPKACGLS